MNNDEKTIRNYIRMSKGIRVFLLISFAIAAILVVIGSYFVLNKNEATAEKFDSITSDESAFSYIDVIGVSDWIYEYTVKNDATTTTTTFYFVLDTNNRLNVATISKSDYARMGAHRAYYYGEIEDTPKSYRITGIAQPLKENSKRANELFKVSGLETWEEFESYFGNMYLIDGYNPMEEKGSTFYLIALFVGLIWFIVFLCNIQKLVKTSKSIRLIKKDGKLEDAAYDLESRQPIGPCVIGNKYFFVKNQGIAIPLSSIKNCINYSTGLLIRTDVFKEFRVFDLKPEIAKSIFDALPIGEKEAVFEGKSR